MTADDYAWLLHECRANADWQLNVRVSFAGRLLKSEDNPHMLALSGGRRTWAMDDQLVVNHTNMVTVCIACKAMSFGSLVKRKLWKFGSLPLTAAI